MKLSKHYAGMVVITLAMFMAATRFEHFGSAVSLPDASYAIFFLGGLFLTGFSRIAIPAFVALIMEAVVIDYYATAVQGVSDYCMTPAYWFMALTYGGLWLVGRWFALRYTMQGRSLLVLILAAWLANSVAFAFSNATFYLLSERFNDMSATEYMSRVAQYYVSYIAVAMLYIACAVGLHIAFSIFKKSAAQAESQAH